jgi:hypothetical protein
MQLLQEWRGKTLNRQGGIWSQQAFYVSRTVDDADILKMETLEGGYEFLP